jgi:SAM-dependent methyltransferase
MAMNFTARDPSWQPAAAVLEWEESNCPLCDGMAYSPLIEAADPLPTVDGLWFMVVQCQECGLCFTNPRPGPGSIGRFYPASYVCHRRPQAVRRRRKRRDPLARLLPPQGFARLLDFGCGAGEFLCRMRGLGWNVTGLDISEEVVGRLRVELNLHTLAGTLPHPELADGSFEAVTMWQALEHVHRPLEVLRAAFRLLTPGGKLLVAVPNIDSHSYHWFGTAWYALDVPRHLTHFTPVTLRLMLHRAGFDVGEVRMIRHPGWVRHSARLLARRPRTAPVLTRLLKTRTVSGLAGWYSYFCRKSDCMLAIATRL